MTPASVKEALIDKINSKKAVVAVFGLGYVGLPLAVEKAKVGFKVLGVDRNGQRVAQINRGENYIKDVKDAELKDAVQGGRIKAFADEDAEVLQQADVVVICVPTPLTKNLFPDLSYVANVTEVVGRYLRRGQLVTLESTTYPGTTQEIMLPKLSQGPLRVGKDFFLAYSPERVDPGNQRFTTNNTSKVVGGVTPACLEVALAFYNQTIQQTVPVSSPAVAELTKVFENTYRSVNIALVNELTLLCDKMGIDVWEVLDAAGTKPFGIQIFYPGPGVGGHCIPIDPFYLTWKAREFDFHTRFIELAGEINIHMPYFVVDKLVKALNKEQKSLGGSKILVLGAAYKKDVSDIRESPALKIMQLLLKEKAKVAYHDPYVPQVTLEEGITLHNTPLSNVGDYDCVLIATDHSSVDYHTLVAEARLVFDTRNAAKDVLTGREKIVKL